MDEQELPGGAEPSEPAADGATAPLPPAAETGQRAGRGATARRALTGRAAGWVVAAVLAGIIIGLLVGVTRPVPTVAVSGAVRQFTIGPAGLPAGANGFGPAGVRRQVVIGPGGVRRQIVIGAGGVKRQIVIGAGGVKRQIVNGSVSPPPGAPVVGPAGLPPGFTMVGPAGLPPGFMVVGPAGVSHQIIACRAMLPAGAFTIGPAGLPARAVVIGPPGSGQISATGPVRVFPPPFQRMASWQFVRQSALAAAAQLPATWAVPQMLPAGALPGAAAGVHAQIMVPRASLHVSGPARFWIGLAGGQAAKCPSGP